MLFYVSALPWRGRVMNGGEYNILFADEYNEIHSDALTVIDVTA